MQLNLLPTIQQAISGLLLTYEPEFLRFGNRLFLSFATIIIVWHGVQMMFSREGLGDSMFEFAKLRELSAVVDMSSAARRRRDAAPVNGHQWSATFRSDNGYGGASAAIEAEASMCASISR